MFLHSRFVFVGYGGIGLQNGRLKNVFFDHGFSKVSGLENRLLISRFVTKRYGEIGLQNASSKIGAFLRAGFK